jgi:hypothetical protein
VEEGNIREIIGQFIGKTISDITQTDLEEFEETGEAYIVVQMSDGSFLRFPIEEGLSFFDAGQGGEEQAVILT